jgi:glycosyltransferase involved in cell wall biosynthesis
VAGRDWSRPRFLFVGLDWERKNGPALLAAFAALRERVPDAHLDVVGGHPRLEADGVTGHGRLDLADPDDRARMRALYESATVFVMPSLHEPLGLSHIEAAAAGIPSIGTTNGGARTFIADGGRLVDPADRGALLSAMIELSDGALARRLGERALARAALFTWEKVAERLIRALAPPDVDLSGLAEFL